MIDYLDIPMGGGEPDKAAELDPDWCSPFDSLEELAPLIRSSHVKNARLLGGEPLDHPRAEELISLLRVLGFQRLSVQTGGQPLRNRLRREQFFRMGVRLFEVRFLSSRRREHDKLAGRGGSFAEAWKAMEHVKKAGEEGLGGGPTFLEVRLLVTPHNLATLERTMAEMGRWPVQQLAVIPGRQPFSLTQASRTIREGIEHVLAHRKWVYLEGWPACLFQKWELHLRELTRRTGGSKSFAQECENCGYRIFCAGIPGWFRPGPDPSLQPVLKGHKWENFHARVILQKA